MLHEDQFQPFSAHWNTVTVHARAPCKGQGWKSELPENEPWDPWRDNARPSKSLFVTKIVETETAFVQMGNFNLRTLTSFFCHVKAKQTAVSGSDFCLWMELSTKEDLLFGSIFSL